MERKGLSESLRGYRKVLKLTKKPDRKEFMQTAKICALGIVLVAIVGFVIKLVSSLIQGTTF
ncbi:MAG TPA: protein translocase SEC61 complex subunit gamma [Candidatus Methanofastidiosa archaeon]|nr:protein translocase SEC61 complex subunit gamma [Candidatus Methanofastidiosa archaeon]HPR41327.1 protein translocase SEC61 complex subunit gamma [Candidatus Methanofastidiosa archaeon]